ncbi:hypothetical protein LCGC14_1512350 [marine sediment metagenome]|uniref:DUF3347 domain-containing protein n=2 Tax=root TaxID=1 RepID=A0A831VXG5_9FLAO|nr:DUF3347 domain-containing protein [Pricia antarctica]
MQNLKLSVAAVTLLLFSFANAQDNEKKAHDHSKMDMDSMDGMQMAPEFNDENLANAYGHYEHIKDALIGSNPGDAQKGGTMLNDALANIDGSDAALSASKKLTGSDDLKSQRKAFAELSSAMEPLLAGKLESGKIYKDFCPMALGKGAYWLSSTEDIRNPYYGDKMLSCGKVTEVIEK